MKDQNCGYCMRGELLDAFGIYIINSDGRHTWAGDCRQSFTIQSIVKPRCGVHRC